MRKIFFIISFLSLSLISNSQTLSEPFRLFVRSNFAPPLDTVIAPVKIGEMRTRVTGSDTSVYICAALTGKKWYSIKSSVTFTGSTYTVTNEANNRIITSTSAGAGNAESTLTYDGVILKVDENFQAGASLDPTLNYVTVGRTSNYPYVVWNNKLHGTANEKIWDAYCYNNVFSYRLINDTYSGATEWMKIIRSGMSVTSIDYPSGRVLYGATDDGSSKMQVGGNVSIGSASAFLIGSIGSDYSRKIGLGETPAGFPILYFRNGAAGANSKLYEWYFDNSGTSVFRAINDANSSATNIWEINRSGTTITAFKFSFLSGTGTRDVTVTSDGTLGTSSRSTVTGSGAFSSKLRVVDNADFTVASDDYTILIKNNTTSRTGTIFAASGSDNRVLRIVNTGTASVTSSVALRISPSTTTTTIGPNTTVEIQSDGTDLWIIGTYSR